MRNLINILTKTQAVVIATVLVAGSMPFTAIAAVVNPAPTPGDNPSLGNSCGFDVVLVMDSSGSISNSELGDMKDALNGFVDALVPSTPTMFSVVEFDDAVVPTTLGFTTDPTSIHARVNAAVSGGATNWEAGLDEAAAQFGGRPDSANLVVFASDGNPTVNNDSNATSGTTDGNDLNNAITEANVIKASGTRIVTIGIGNGVSQGNLEDISSADAYYSATDFSDLPGTLSDIVTDLCGGSISIHKTIKDGDSEVSGGAGWVFTVDGDQYVTDDTGSVNVPLSAGSYTVTETSGPSGYTFDTASCTKGQEAIDGTLDSENHEVDGVSLNDQDVVSCNFTNDVVHDSATVHAQKVICDAEADLPNWGDGNGPDITATTASDYVAAHSDVCHLADWDFQWATADATNPGDNLEDGGAGWNSFTNTAVIPTTAEGANFWFREELPSGYIQFSGDTTDPRDQDVSAEMYCDTDHLNYDNYDFINGLKIGDEKYCVAFNVPTETPPTDVCSNIEGDQASVPEGYEENDGICTPIDNGGSTDVCPNIAGDQASVPSGKVLVNGLCLPKAHHSRGGGGGGNNGGQVLGASTCGPLLNQYLHLGWKNDSDQVSKLQDFLNTQLGINLPVNGFFGNDTFNAVKQFQIQYGNDVLNPWVGLPASGITGPNTPTGYVYQTTRWKINNIFCPGSEAFPSTLN